MNNFKDIDKFDDPEWTLKKWKREINVLIDQYGENSILATDAGCNNVSFKLEAIK